MLLVSSITTLYAYNPSLCWIESKYGLTLDVIDRNQLVGQIFIQPAKTIEFVILDFTVSPTGTIF